MHVHLFSIRENYVSVSSNVQLLIFHCTFQLCQKGGKQACPALRAGGLKQNGRKRSNHHRSPGADQSKQIWKCPNGAQLLDPNEDELWHVRCMINPGLVNNPSFFKTHQPRGTKPLISRRPEIERTTISRLCLISGIRTHVSIGRAPHPSVLDQGAAIPGPSTGSWLRKRSPG